MNRRAAGRDRVERPAHPNDRRRLVTAPLNDPGPFRGIASNDEGRREQGRAIGMNYHPEGNPMGFSRARLEPLDREGRRIIAQDRDRQDRPNIPGGSYPPRRELAANLARREERYEVVRGPNRQQRRRH